MQVSASFKNSIQSYLEQRAEYDELFARSYRNPFGKSSVRCPLKPK